jgi:pyruvate dehydrogenase E1 component alpha subunit
MNLEAWSMASTKKTETTKFPLEKSDLVDLYRQMYLIREFENSSAEQYAMGKIAGFLHLYIGEEAIAVGAIKAMEERDHLLTHYRDHGYALALGMDTGAVMAELFGKETGVTGGRGGSMHLADVSKNFWGGYAIVSGHLLLAVGLGFASDYKDEGRVTVCVFGDGATNAGAFHEAMNMAKVWNLPVLFLCENNLYGMGTAVEHVSAVKEMSKKALGYDIPSVQVNGQDVIEMYEKTKEALDYCRAGNGPMFMEALTYRFRGHSMADPEQYREREEIDQYRAYDPIPLFRDQLLKENIVTQDGIDQIHKEVNEEVEAAVKFADESPEPDVESLGDFVYADPINVR